MKCQKCNETDHPKTALFCHMCGSRLVVDANTKKGLSGDEERKLKKKKRKRIVWEIVASLFYVLLSFMEYDVFEAWGIIAIIFNALTVFQFIGDHFLVSRKAWRLVLKLLSPLFFFFEMCFFPNGWSLLILPATFVICTVIYNYRKGSTMIAGGVTK